MTDLSQTEAAIRSNEPVVLFTVDGKDYSTPILPINKADLWLDKAEKLDELEADIRLAATEPLALKTAKRKFTKALYKCVFDYNPAALPRAELEDKVSPAQMVDAFARLRELTDPFVQAQIRVATDLRRQMDRLPPWLVEKALAASQ